MRIAYCTNVRLPSERAHGHQVAQVCDALIHLGHSVHVFAPYRENTVRADYWSYYGAEKEVELTYLGSFDPIDRWWLPKYFQIGLLNRAVKKGLREKLSGDRFDVLYTRAPALLPALLETGTPTILELHQLPARGRSKFIKLCNQCALVACLTTSMRDMLISWGVPSAKVIAEGDAVDLRRFQKMPSQEVARRRLNVETERIVVGYVGRLKTLGMEKGVKFILESIKELRSSTPVFGLIVGGPDRDTEYYKKIAADLGLTTDDVLFTGDIPAQEVPTALSACNVLAMPFPDLPHYRLHMSPLKMFEYMAAGKPIIATELPTVRDVLSEENAIFAKPGDTASLTESIKWVLHHKNDADERGVKARKLAEHHTWEERMKRILDRVSA